MTWTEYLISRRTLTEDDVAVRAAAHDAQDMLPEDRVTLLDTDTIRGLVHSPRPDHTTVLSG